MQMHEFETEIGRLKSTYGDKSLPDARVQIIWREVKNLPAYWMKKTVDAIVADSRMAPTLQDFRSAAISERARSKTGTIEKPRTGCEHCRGIGFFLCGKKNEIGKWAFRCRCEAGENESRNHAPQFKQDHADQGFYFLDIAPSLVVV